ncbi:hypothetical protein C8Q79DRAFT_664261 [Trametes meyenii]|nr:hypothetical protein C8Q79DRAFT_664261 [Trametes meyenii]
MTLVVATTRIRGRSFPSNYYLSRPRCKNKASRTFSSSAIRPSPNSRHDDNLQPLATRPVPAASPALTSPQAFLACLRSPAATPFLLRAPAATQPGPPKRAETLLRALRAAGSRSVEVEAGRYDRAAEFNRVEVPLDFYLDWLEEAGGEARGERELGVQLYLAQWRARDEVPGLADLVKTPSLLEPLLESRGVDLYQSSFFIGPLTTVTPLHYDPYFNLYNVYASSDPSVHAKHFVLLPPTLSQYLTRADDGSVLRNTSPVEFHVLRTPPGADPEVAIDPVSAPERTRDAILESDAALSCVVREGDTLFIPRRWWHRVENITLPSGTGSTGGPGWTAGVGWWFLPRNS